VSDALAAVAAQLDDGEALVAQLAGPFARCIRRHPQRGTPSGWGALEPLAWTSDGFVHDAAIDPGTRLDYHTGLVWPQDGASQVPVRLLDPQPGEVVVDCCAAPGSKSTQIGLALGGDGLLVCLDASAPRRRTLAETLARQGVTAGLVCPLAVRRLAAMAPGCADAVLVDAPCSGHVPRSTKQAAREARRQQAILGDAAELVRPGGRLVYSTCTPYREEDEGVIAAFLAAHPGWVVEPVDLPGCDADLDRRGGLRLWPQRQGTEPFFACRLRAPGAGARRDIAGELPPFADDDPPGAQGLHCWRRGQIQLIANPDVAACALPSEARGLILSRGQGDELDPWAAQLLIERGAPAASVDHATACRLWAGEEAAGLEPRGFLRTEHGAPLGQVDAEGRRLRLPSRMRRSGLF